MKSTELDLERAGMLPPLPGAFARRDDLDLLAPLRMLERGLIPDNKPRAADRRGLAEALANTNAAYGHPEAEDLARRLADPACRVVVTGQQPGLLGGPLFTLSKAVAAVAWARRLEESGTPAVAVFWVATEDHDFREVAQTVFLPPEGPRIFTLGEDTAPLMPVGMRSLGSEIGTVLSELRLAMPGDRFGEWVDTLGRWYRPETRFGEAFSQLMVHLLGPNCPLLVDAMLPEVKVAQGPWLGLLVERRRDIEDAIGQRERLIESRGYELQIKPQPGASPLFLLHGNARRRIQWMAEDRFVLRGYRDLDERVEWLLGAIDENPSVVSPGVQARSAIQDAILGSTLQVVGPGELSYLPQIAPLYDLLGIPVPAVALRPQILVLEEHQYEKLDAAGLSLEELMAPELDLDEVVAQGAGQKLLAPARGQLEEVLGHLGEAALKIDPGLERPWQKTRGQMIKALDLFAGKVSAAVARRDEVTHQRAARLRTFLRPLGSPQERVVSVSQFPGKYGNEFVEALFEQIQLDSSNLQVIHP